MNGDSQTPPSIEPRIRNCRFKHECDQSWVGMKETGRPHVRFCEQCRQEVYYVKNRTELALAIQNNRCVCMPYDLFDRKEQQHVRTTPQVIPDPIEKTRTIRVTMGTMTNSLSDELAKVRDPSDIPAWLRKTGGKA